MAHNYDVGTRAWQPDAVEGWVASEVVDRKVNGDKVTLVFALENGEVLSIRSRGRMFTGLTVSTPDEDDRDDPSDITR